MYEISKIKSNTTPIDNIIDYGQLNQYLEGKYQVMITCFDKICLGEYADGSFKLEALPAFNTIQSMRLFNAEMELYLWRAAADDGFGQADYLTGRIRKDEPGEDCPVVEAEQILIGSKKGEGATDDYMVIKEDRGFELKVPKAWCPREISDRSRLILRSRNYLQEWDNGQLSYCDHRFVSIEQKEV